MKEGNKIKKVECKHELSKYHEHSHTNSTIRIPHIVLITRNLQRIVICIIYRHISIDQTKQNFYTKFNSMKQIAVNNVYEVHLIDNTSTTSSTFKT